MDTNSISKIREPIHAPSWYSNNRIYLYTYCCSLIAEQLNGWVFE